MTSPISDAILKWFSFLKNDVLVKGKHRFTLAKTLFSTLENDVFCRRKRYYDYHLASVYGFDSMQKGQKFSVFLMLFSYFLPYFRPTFCPFLSFCCHLPPFCHHPAVPLSRRIPRDWWQSGSKILKIIF